MNQPAVLVRALIDFPNCRQAEMRQVMLQLFEILPAEDLDFSRIGTAGHTEALYIDRRINSEI